MNLTTALSILTSNDSLVLTSGEHILDTPISIEHLSNITIYTEGLEPAEIQCQDDCGLTFFEIDNLVISNVIFSHCSVTGSPLESIVKRVQMTGELDINIPQEIIVGILLASSVNITLNQVTVRNTSGIGLMGLNVMGNVIIDRSTFENNRRPLCSFTESRDKQAGGGVFLYYHDNLDDAITTTTKEANIIITHSHFHNNQGCNINGLAMFYVRYLPDFFQQLSGYVPGEGALALFTSQHQINGTSVHMLVESTNFTNNTGRTGSAISILTFAGTWNTNVEISKCLFKGNGRITKVDGLNFFIGGAISMLLDVTSLADAINGFPLYNFRERNLSVTITDSVFTDNLAHIGGAIALYSYQLSLTINTLNDVANILIDRCTFVRNSAIFGGALYIQDEKFTGFDLGVQLRVKDTSIVETTVSLESAILESLRLSSSAVACYTMNMTFEGNTIISETSGSGIRATESAINILGSLTLTRNNGVYGGGMQLLRRSFVVMMNRSSLIITDNTAAIAGGGIYANYYLSESIIQYSDCTIFFETIDPITCIQEKCSPNKSSLTITGNNAPLGNVLFGSTLETCYWVPAVRMMANDAVSHILLLLQDLFPEHFVINSTDINFAFNTISRSLIGNSTVKGIPGETLDLKMVALDQLNNTLPVAIASQTQGKGAKARLGSSGYWFLDRDDLSVPLTVNGSEDNTVEVIVYTIDTYTTAVIRVELGDCSPGFIYDNNTQSCICIPELDEYNIKCDIDREAIILPLGKWIGQLDSSDDFTLSNLVVADCHQDYCSNNQREIINGSFDVQCKEGYYRTGLLCSECQEGYSITMAGSKCHRCPNWWIVFIVVVYLVAGVLYIVVLAFFEVNITVGLINGFIFYENIGHLYTDRIFPVDIGFYPFELSNFNIPFEVCFYNGLTILARNTIRITFIVYLLILMAIIYTAAKYVKHLTKTGPRIIKAFATLLILCYVQVIEIFVPLFPFYKIKTLSGEVHVRWFYDTSVTYFSALHGLLSVLAIVIVLFYVIPLPLLLLVPRVLYRLKYVNYFKPLLDAFWAPFKPKFRFWLGLKLLMRLLLFLVTTFQPKPLNGFLVTFFLFLFLVIEVHVQPFNGKWQNLANVFFTANLTLLFIVMIYFEPYQQHIAQAAIAGVLTLSAMGVLALIIIYHLKLRWPELKTEVYRKLKKNTVTAAAAELAAEERNSTSPLLSPTPPKVSMFTILREPLLDDEIVLKDSS